MDPVVPFKDVEHVLVRVVVAVAVGASSLKFNIKSDDEGRSLTLTADVFGSFFSLLSTQP